MQDHLLFGLGKRGSQILYLGADFPIYEGELKKTALKPDKV